METLTDDIPDPATPTGVRGALAIHEGFDLSQLKDLCLVYVHEAMEALTEDARNSLARLTTPPAYNERVTVTARSPQGFMVEISTAKATAEELLHALGAICGWCQANQYVPV